MEGTTVIAALSAPSAARIDRFGQRVVRRFSLQHVPLLRPIPQRLLRLLRRIVHRKRIDPFQERRDGGAHLPRDRRVGDLV